MYQVPMQLNFDSEEITHQDDDSSVVGLYQQLNSVVPVQWRPVMEKAYGLSSPPRDTLFNMGELGFNNWKQSFVDNEVIVPGHYESPQYQTFPIGNQQELQQAAHPVQKSSSYAKLNLRAPGINEGL